LLYLISTPIGNLKDITLRALEILQSSDLILCEDTRHSKVLLDHYNISRPLKSYHKFNESKSIDEILSLLKSGKNIALISDAGTPGIQDPGAILVKACLEHHLQVSAAPGACALSMALSLSAEQEGPFQFVGFFPKKQTQLKQALLNALNYEGHTLAYVSSHELLSVILELVALDPQRKITLWKELTKLYETRLCGTSDELLNLLKNSSIKGEFVLLIHKAFSENLDLDLSLQEHVEKLEKTFSLSKNEAIKLAAKQRGLSKREIYNQIMKN